jgi:hypothetical protein
MIASASAASVGDGTGEADWLGLGSLDSVGSGVAVEPDGLGSSVSLGVADGLPVASAVALGLAADDAVAEALGEAAGDAVADGLGLAVAAGRLIGTTMIEPPVVEALDSTTAACSESGSITTDPGFDLSETSAWAPASSDAQPGAVTGPCGQTASTVATLTVYEPLAPGAAQATLPGVTAIGVWPALGPGPVPGVDRPTPA